MSWSSACHTWLQVLIANRLKIVWCTKLMRASSDDETAAIEREMYNDATLVDILGQLKATRASGARPQECDHRGGEGGGAQAAHGGGEECGRA